MQMLRAAEIRMEPEAAARNLNKLLETRNAKRVIRRERSRMRDSDLIVCRRGRRRLCKGSRESVCHLLDCDELHARMNAPVPLIRGFHICRSDDSHAAAKRSSSLRISGAKQCDPWFMERGGEVQGAAVEPNNS
jgi:hypothetical protein